MTRFLRWRRTRARWLGAVALGAAVLGAGPGACAREARVRVANESAGAIRVSMLAEEGEEDIDRVYRAAADVAAGGVFEYVRRGDSDFRPYWRVRIDVPARDGRASCSFVSALDDRLATELVVRESDGGVAIRRGR